MTKRLFSVLFALLSLGKSAFAEVEEGEAESIDITSSFNYQTGKI